MIAIDRDDRTVHTLIKLLGKAGRADIVDALVVLGAVRRGDEVLTSDPADLAALIDASPRRIPLTFL